MKRNHVPALDGLRALAALAVLGFHTGVVGFSGGSLGVDVFFVLSGWLITGLLVTEHQRTGRIDVRAFFARRARRLLPGLLVFLAGFALVAQSLFGMTGQAVAEQTAAAAFYVMDLVAPLQADTTPITHAWTLAVEVQFYVLWPLILPWLIKREHPAALLLAVWLLITGLRMAVLGQSYSLGYFSPLHSTGLLLGAALALRPVRILPAWFGLAVLALLFACKLDNRLAIPLAEFATAVLLPGLVAPTRVAKALSCPPLAAVGVVSYGVYLWHHPISRALEGSAHRGLFTLFASLALASLSYWLIERRVLDRARPLMFGPSVRPLKLNFGRRPDV